MWFLHIVNCVWEMVSETSLQKEFRNQQFLLPGCGSWGRSHMLRPSLVPLDGRLSPGVRRIT